MFNSTHDSFLLQRYTNYRIQNKQTLDSLKQVLKTSYPQYYNFQYDNQLVDLNHLQAVLEDKTTWIQYHLSDDIAYIIAASKGQLQFDTIEHPAELKNRIKSLLEVIYLGENPSLSSKESLAKFKQAAHVLYKALLQDYIATESQHLVICPSGFLNFLPFEVLLSSEQTQVQNFLELEYLVQRHSISYQKSATLYNRLKFRVSESKPHEILAVAPFSSTGNNKNQDAPIQLPHTLEELQFLKDHFAADTLTALSATKSAFEKQANKYQIIHLSTHGQANDSIPGNAYLKFFPTRHLADQKEVSSELYAYEIQNQQYNADLAILSACDTGRGLLDQGEGHLSLSRAFIYAGIPSTLMSKWKVNDQSGSKIISLFYKYLKSGSPKDIALQNAKTEFLELYADPITAHPYYWAAFAQLGNREPIHLKSQNRKRNFYLYASIFAAFLLSVSLFRRK